MGQQQILDFLRGNKGWYSSKEIAKGIQIGVSSVIGSLKKLRKTNFLKFKRKEREYIYHSLSPR